MEHGIVGRNETSLFKYQGWPTVCKDENGVLYVASSSHRIGHVCPFGKNYLYTSNDDGKTWSEPRVINDTPLDDRDAGILSLGDNKLLVMWFNHPREFYQDRDKRKGTVPTSLVQGAYDLWNEMPNEYNNPGSFVRISNDSGVTWSEPYKVPLTAPHGPIRLKSGRLFLLGRAFWAEDLENNMVYSAVSDDEGKTWQVLSKVDVPDEMNEMTMVCEPYAIELSDGSILGAIRFEDKTSRATCYNYTIHLCISHNGGKTFSKPTATGICGSPPHFMRHSSGAIILTYGRRVAPCGQYAKISYDEGKTWSEEIPVSPESPDWDHGYPSTVELSDGKLLTVYYQKWKDDEFNSILYSKWELPKK